MVCFFITFGTFFITGTGLYRKPANTFSEDERKEFSFTLLRADIFVDPLGHALKMHTNHNSTAATSIVASRSKRYSG